MALLDDDDIRGMVAAIGDDTIATVGTADLAVVFNARREALLGSEITISGPYAVACAADVEALGIVAGNDGDALTINGTEYTVLTIDPNGFGSAILTLCEAT